MFFLLFITFGLNWTLFFNKGYMHKFIQSYFFYHFIFSLLTKQKRGKFKSFLFFHFFILPSFSILYFFTLSNQTDPQLKVDMYWCYYLNTHWIQVQSLTSFIISQISNLITSHSSTSHPLLFLLFLHFLI